MEENNNYYQFTKCQRNKLGGNREMLKIKDNVDLKELEKFGFNPKYDVDTGKLVEMYRISGDRKGTTLKYEDNFNGKHDYRDFWHIFTWNRRICNHGYSLNLDITDYEILYDLIKADLVEKVGD